VDLDGQMLSHYRILGRIGAGGMGEVYRAHDPRLGRDVAVKVLPTAYSTDPDRLARFNQEARAASKLDHPNILVIHDIGVHEGQPYVVSELLEGETLGQRLVSGPIPVRKAIDYGLQIVQGLAAAHDKGIVHRDLKPANLFLTRDGRVKILDFGLAKLVQAEDASTLTTATSETEPGVVMGTVGYMSPEQVRGQPTDHRSDIFAFGAVLYEMLTGRRAFQGQSAADTMSAILKEDPPALMALNPGVSPALERVVRHCFEKDPTVRFQSARDLAFDLQAISESSRPGAPSGSRSRSRIWLALGVAAGVLATGAVLWLGRGVRRPEPKPPASEASAGHSAPPTGAQSLPLAQQPDVVSVAVLPFVNMSEDPSNEYFSDGVSEELLNALAQIPGLRVTGRTSAFSFKGKNEDLRVIGQKLNVGAILEGSVRKSGKHLRITAQLVNAADGFHLWSETYDRTLDDIFAVQEDIARSVTGALRVALAVDKGTELRSRGGSDNVNAYNAYLQAEYFFKRANWSKGDLEKALGYYEQALALDPGYALAWAGLGLIKSVVAGYGKLPPVDEGYRQAREALERALALDANLAEAHAGLATIKMMHDWDWAGMEAEYRQAIDLAPGNANTLGGAATAFGMLGRFEESVALFRRALEVDPLGAGNWILLGCTLLNAGGLEEAEGALKKGVELNPGYAGAFSFLGRVYLSEGRPEAALVEVQRETQRVWRIQGLALVNHALGRKKEADAALVELIEGFQNDWAVQIAEAYAFRGEPDRAFEWLDRAFVQHEPGLLWVKTSSSFRSLKSDPRYAAFLNRMGLPL
jgi:serine/threonine protein kinase/tetratricopeptide (TPR) repeat protein